MELFNGNVKTWNVPNKTNTLLDRFETYKNVMELIGKETPREIEALERIGSSSTMGEVYSHKIDNQIIASKILPIISSRPLLNNLKEMKKNLKKLRFFFNGGTNYIQSLILNMRMKAGIA